MASANSFLYRMDYGIPGDLSRASQGKPVEPGVMGATAFGSYGMPAKLAAGLLIPLAANNDKAHGFLVRPNPINPSGAYTPGTTDALGTAAPPGAKAIVDVLIQGYIWVPVQLGVGTVAAGSAVYVRYQNPSGGQVVGGVEGATSGNNYALTGAVFTGQVDTTKKVAEIYFDSNASA